MMKKKRRHLISNEDKLSDLPECVLVHILSFLNIKEAVRTCLLSKKWKHHWKRLQILSLTIRDFNTLRGFTQFVNHVISLRDASTALIALDFRTLCPVEPRLVETVETFAASQNQNLKRLTLYYYFRKFPPFLFSCHRLESLTLKGAMHADVVFPDSLDFPAGVVFPDSLDLPALTYLDLSYFVFASEDDNVAEPFSGFNKLNTLIIRYFKPHKDAQAICISNAMLVNLLLDTSFVFSKIEISAPSLCTLLFNGDPCQKLSGSSLSSVKHVGIHGCAAQFNRAAQFKRANILLNWLLELVHIESLTISCITLWALSHIPDILKRKLTSWCNLKSLQVELYPHQQILIMMTQRDPNYEVAGGKPWKGNVKLQEAIKALEPYESIPDGVIGFFIQNSPDANVSVLIPKENRFILMIPNDPKHYYLL